MRDTSQADPAPYQTHLMVRSQPTPDTGFIGTQQHNPGSERHWFPTNVVLIPKTAHSNGYKDSLFH